MVEQGFEIRRGRVRGPAEPPKALVRDRLDRDAAGALDVVGIRLRLVQEDIFIRPELVGEGDDTSEEMRQRRCVGQRRAVRERVREPRAPPLAQQLGRRPRVVGVERLPYFRRSAARASRPARRPAMMSEHRVEQRTDARAPLLHDVVEAQKCADFGPIEAQQRLGEVSRRPQTAPGQIVPPHLELEAGVQLAEVVQEREVCEASRGRVGESRRPCRPDEPRPQHRFPEQRFEAGGDIGAMVFKAMDAA